MIPIINICRINLISEILGPLPLEPVYHKKTDLNPFQTTITIKCAMDCCVEEEEEEEDNYRHHHYQFKRARKTE